MVREKYMNVCYSVKNNTVSVEGAIEACRKRAMNTLIG